MAMKPWKTLERHTLLKHNKFLTVESHTVELPDGRVIEDWPWLEMPDFVNILAETGDEKFICFRQTKYSVKGVSLAPVGGYLEPGEEPETAGRRELREETGCEASEWIGLGSFPIDGNRGAGTAHFYLARGAHPVAPIYADDLEEQEIIYLSREEMAAALDQGEFKLLPWMAIISLGLHYLDTHESVQ
jgi:ADP-ribose pyrophosphatase